MSADNFDEASSEGSTDPEGKQLEKDLENQPEGYPSEQKGNNDDDPEE
jgi:hypothetical protein